MAAPGVGDTIDIDWGNGRRDTGIIDQVLAGTVRVRVPGPPEIKIVVAAVQLGEAGSRRWTLQL